MTETPKSYPLEIIEFCEREMETVRSRLDEAVAHLRNGEAQAALGASDGLPQQLALACTALELLVRIYPRNGNAQRSLALTP